MSEPFKLDNGKPMVELVLGDFAPALLEVAKVGTMGAIKYSPHGWRDNDAPIQEKINRIADAKGRHRLLSQSGELVDPESGLLHRAHEAWNVLAQLTLELQQEKAIVQCLKNTFEGKELIGFTMEDYDGSTKRD